MLLRPSPVLTAVDTGGDRAMVVVGRILGARHVTQAVLSGAKPSPHVLAMGVWVDAVHALCALCLAGASPGRTAPGLVDAIGSIGWAVAGHHDLVNPRSIVPSESQRRDAMAAWTLARVPGGPGLLRKAEHERGRSSD